MTEEEFQESDVMFSVSDAKNSEDYNPDTDESRRAKRKKVENKDTKTKPVAVDIPVNMAWFRYIKPSLFEHENEGDQEMVPPHLIIRRRLQDKMAFSVCSGIGRTLKGRDLSEMRNSVLRMTGFLES
ncbi:senescence regulator [Tanacetum coccineum]